MAEGTGKRAPDRNPGSDCHEIPQVGLVDFVVDEDVRDSRELAEVLRKLA
ncbi:MAG: PHP-associated domain-containing protein [Lachnospiraceae bacterium]